MIRVLLSLLEHIPAPGEVVEYEDLKFEVVSLDKYRVSEVKVKRKMAA
ncbi:MAG TPA: transporter associated domain-containing protein [Candidatus Obscuribacterales bacterium]